MSILQNFITPKRFTHLCVRNTSHNLIPFSNPIFFSLRKRSSVTCLAISKSSEPEADPEPSSIPNPEIGIDEDPDASFPTTIPRKKRRGRRSEAVQVEDFVRESLERTFASIKQQNSGIMENKDNVLKDRIQDDVDSESSDDDDDDENEDADIGRSKKKKMVVEEEDPNWPLDADVGWGVRASEYFEEHPIKNVVGEDGFEIDWEGEVDDNWVKEINCLEWESFAFHPSPLVVLVFERYNRATSNWKTLKELEKAIKVYWSAKDRLPPRAVKLDINIERDLAYALKVKECPQILFLLGNRILYRDKEFRTSDELVQMIAHFYYKAKKPSWVNYAAASPP